MKVGNCERKREGHSWGSLWDSIYSYIVYIYIYIYIYIYMRDDEVSFRESSSVGS